ncbi:uncharacterized protein LOC143826518 isoform X2 [Paroedura picta]|uniref:uncharacterized protein LOC143826518 isoform X2 n=1 Tax=Paroedura picta TaxID=143630 RepID=UPI004055C7B1
MQLLLWAASVPLLLCALQPSPPASLTLPAELVKDEEGASSFPAGAEPQKSVQDLSWRSIYTPVKSCHTELREKHGEFSPPSFLDSFEGNIWCNWTIWAGSRKHIVVSIKGFRSGERCDVNGDKIFFHGISSPSENALVYACWQKEVHVFDTFAQGVHVVLLLRHSAHLRKEKFVGQYYIFRHREKKTPPEGLSGSSEVLMAELSRLVLTRLPQSEEEEAFLSVGDRVNASLSASHRTDWVAELSKSPPARREDARFADLPSSVWQGTSTEHLIPASPGLLSTPSMDNRNFPFAPETFIELRGHHSWAPLSEPTTPSDALSYVPYQSASPPIKPSSPTEGPALPSTVWGAFIVNEPQAGGELMQPDHLALAGPSLPLSLSTLAPPEGDNDVLSSRSVEEVTTTSFQDGTPAPEGMSRDAPRSETASPPHPEQDWMETETQGDSFLLPSKTAEQGWPCRQPGCPGARFSVDLSVSPRESGTAPVPEGSAGRLDLSPALGSGKETVDLLEPHWAPCSSPCGRLPLKTSSGSTEADLSPEWTPSADVSLDPATEMPDEPEEIDREGQSSSCLDGKTEPERPPSLERATVIPVVPAASVFSLFSRDRDWALKAQPTLPAPPTEASLAHGWPKSFFPLAIPDGEPTPSDVDSVLSPSVVLTCPPPCVDAARALSALDPSSLVLSGTTPALSSAPERMGIISSGPERAWSETTAILQTSTEAENVLSANVMPSSTTTLNSLASEQARSASAPVNGRASSVGLLGGNAVETGNSFRACSQHLASTFTKEDLPPLTAQPSGPVDRTLGVDSAAAESKHFFPATKTVFPKKPLSEGKNDSNLVTAFAEGDEGPLLSDPVKPFDFLSKTESFLPLGGVTANGPSAQDEPVPGTPRAFVPLPGEEKSLVNPAFRSRSPTALTAASSQTQTQAPAVLPGPSKSPEDTRGGTENPQGRWERQPGPEWQKAALEISPADLKVPGPLVKAAPQRSTAEPQAPQAPSGTENKAVSHAAWNEMELGFPWLMVYLPVKSCHVTLMDEAGTFSPPTFSTVQTNNWCNWTIWAGPDKHISIYIEGFEGKLDCEENQDKILFQGTGSSTENKVTYACRNQGTLVFEAQAVAAHVVFLSKASSQNHGPKHFKGRYSISEDSPISASADGDVVPEEPALNSSRRFGIPSHIIHSRYISNFERVGRIPGSENSQPLNTEERLKKTNNASSLEALLGPAVSGHSPVSFSKSTTNVLGMKEAQVIKPSADEFQTGSDAVASNLKENVIFGSNGLEDKEKATLPSHKFSPKMKLVAAGITAPSAGVENSGRTPVHQRPTFRKEAGRAKFERSGFLSGVTFPQVLLREPSLPISPPRSIPEEGQDQVLQLKEISKKVSSAMEFPHVEMKEVAGGERTDGQVMREGAGDRYGAAADGTGRGQPHGTGWLPTNMPGNVFVFRSEENDSVLESQHKPGDVLLEVTFGIEHQGWIPQHGSELEEDLIKSLKMQVQEKVKFISNKVQEIKLKEIKRKERSERKRMNDPNLMLTFWLHLVPEEKNISHFIHSQLEGLGGKTTGSGKIRQVSVGDVNECTSGSELCGDEAVCLNGYGTYSCQCKQGYEDRSLNKSGTLCVQVPPSGLRFLYSYMEIFVGAMIFFIAVIVVALSVLCAILKNRRAKKDSDLPQAASSNTQATSHSQPLAFDLNSITGLLTLDPACLKLRASSPERPLHFGSGPADTFRVSVEQSERL